MFCWPCNVAGNWVFSVADCEITLNTGYAGAGGAAPPLALLSPCLFLQEDKARQVMITTKHNSMLLFKNLIVIAFIRLIFSFDNFYKYVIKKLFE